MTRRRLTVAAVVTVALTLGFSASSRAQSPILAAPDPGVPALSRTSAEQADAQPEQRIRLKLTTDIDGHRSGTWVVGRVVAVDADALQLAMKGHDQPVQIPKPAIRQMEVSRGVSRLDGAAIGLGIGALSGLGLGLLADSNCRGFDLVCGGYKYMGVIAFAPIGAVAGALVGRERWERTPLAGVSIAAAPTRGGFRFRATLTF